MEKKDKFLVYAELYNGAQPLYELRGKFGDYLKTSVLAASLRLDKNIWRTHIMTNFTKEPQNRP